MKENKILQLLDQIEDQINLLYQDFTSAQTEKVRFELDHAKGYTEEDKIKLNQLDSKESYIYDQIYLFNDITSQLRVWAEVSKELDIDTINFVEKLELYKSFLGR